MNKDHCSISIEDRLWRLLFWWQVVFMLVKKLHSNLLGVLSCQWSQVSVFVQQQPWLSTVFCCWSYKSSQLLNIFDFKEGDKFLLSVHNNMKSFIHTSYPKLFVISKIDDSAHWSLGSLLIVLLLSFMKANQTATFSNNFCNSFQFLYTSTVIHL